MSDPFSPAKRHLDIAGLSVMLAMPTHRDLSPDTAISLLDTQMEFKERGIHLEIELTCGSSLVHHARNKMAWRFLRSRCNRLFWVDSDIVWKAKDFTRLVARSLSMDIVGAVYPAKRDPPLFMVKHGSGETNEQGCIAFDGIGLGFTCTSREVMEALAKNAPLRKYHHIPESIPAIFRLDGVTDDGSDMGEDMAFFADAKALGFQLWVDPAVTLGHIGPKTYQAALADYLSQKDNLDG